ncbi:MAG TPA: undecaprenyl-diphosphate phosphatase [Candidatus Polarisedimenticolaceae bacterium]|nr:undecaprenyl-diphosphate phosphatase [Candidatus Polarisedimenticolaceae bacterium]
MIPLPLIALLLGVVEGITEFLPISSTGHLILAARLCGLDGPRAEVFEIFIQLGAVLAVVVEYRAKLLRQGLSLAVPVAIAFLPAAVLGLATHHWISEHLFGPRTVAAALIAGALLILAVERWKPLPVIERAEEAGALRAGLIGLAQCASLWPGFSRSAATILGGLLCGLRRSAATEFSFFLAIPTLGAASVYDLIKKHDALVAGDLPWLLVATAVSFVVAWAAIRWLLRFVATHDLTPFAWYRIALGLLVWAALR